MRLEWPWEESFASEKARIHSPGFAVEVVEIEMKNICRNEIIPL